MEAFDFSVFFLIKINLEALSFGDYLSLLLQQQNFKDF